MTDITAMTKEELRAALEQVPLLLLPAAVKHRHFQSSVTRATGTLIKPAYAQALAANTHLRREQEADHQRRKAAVQVLPVSSPAFRRPGQQPHVAQTRNRNELPLLRGLPAGACGGTGNRGAGAPALPRAVKPGQGQTRRRSNQCVAVPNAPTYVHAQVGIGEGEGGSGRSGGRPAVLAPCVLPRVYLLAKELACPSQRPYGSWAGVPARSCILLLGLLGPCLCCTAHPIALGKFGEW